MALWSPRKKEDTSAGDRPAQDKLQLDVAAGRELLATCCQLKLPATILAPDTMTVLHARFLALDGDGVTLELPQGATSNLRALSTCCVTGFHRGRAFVFMSLIRGFDASERTLPWVRVETPRVVSCTDIRKSFRVPVGHKELSAQVVLVEAGVLLPVELTDLSFGGAMLALPEGSPALTEGTKLRLRIRSRIEDHPASLELEARVRRLHRGPTSRVGVIFPEFTEQGAIDPCQELRDLVLQLERRWIQSRRG